MRVLGFGRNEEEHLLAGISQHHSSSVATVHSSREDDFAEPEDDDFDEEELSPEEQEYADKLAAMSVDELAREVAETIAIGDATETEEEAIVYFERAQAVGQLAMIRVAQHPGS